MNHLSLFSGIGGFDLAAEWMGWQNISHTEWNDFGQKVLHHHWEKSSQHGDITKTDYNIYRGRVDILTGGFPCQPYSVAGKRKGKDDERHLWPEMLRAIREIQPRWIVGENVRGIINWDAGVVFNEVQADLEAEGYEILPFLLPAAGVNAPHERYRTWFVAYSNSIRPGGRTIISDGKIGNTSIRSNIFNETKGFSLQQSTSNSPSKRRKERKQNGGFPNAAQARTRMVNELERLSSEQASTYPDSCIRREICRHETCVRGKTKEQSIDSNISNNGNASNSTSTRQPCEEHRETESGRITKESFPDDWQNFPTQSPVCDGNDGFPTESLRQFFREDSNGVLSEEEIDKILYQAYGKWRNETIKAGGNAIVPQVVFQIFKAIELYESL